MQENELTPHGLEACVKCDICTSVCPMMAVNPAYPGPKQAGPDGERYRLKSPEFFDAALKYCLNCKRCEQACPSGVKVGDIIQQARLKYGHPTRPLRDFSLANTDLVGSVASPLAPVVNGALGLGITASAMDAALGVDKRRTFPKYSRRKFTDLFDPTSQQGYSRYVSYFHGCYVGYNYPQLGLDLVRLMNACGYGVRLLDKEKCCGVALMSNGFGNQAARQAKTNIAAMRRALAEGSEAVLTTSSTCTFTMRDEYPHVLGLDNADIRPSLMLATKFIFDAVESGRIRLAFKPGAAANIFGQPASTPAGPVRIAYHTACHMARLGWAPYSTGLLRMIPGLVLQPLPPVCCGIAGTFGFKKENYEYSQKIGQPLFDAIRASGVPAVATDCETCKWQIEMSTGVRVLNPVSILVAAIDIEKTAQLNNGTIQD